MLDHRARNGQRQLHAAGDQVGQRGTTALVRYVPHLDTGHRAEQLGRQVARSAAARGCKVEFVGFRFRERDQFAQVVRRHRRVDDQHPFAAADHRDRRETLDRVVGRLHQQRRHRMGIGGYQDRVAIRGGLRDRVGSDHRIAARPVFHDHRLAQGLTQFVGDQPRQDVGVSSGRKRRDEADRFVGVGGLRRGRTGQQHQYGCRRHPPECAKNSMHKSLLACRNSAMARWAGRWLAAPSKTHSGLTPAAFRTLADRSISDAIHLPNASGVLATGTAPVRSRLALNAGSAVIWATSF